MPRIPSKLYKQHVENLRELNAALENVARLARAEIASGDSHGTLRTLLRLYAFLIGAWAECRLRKLLHEEFGYSDDQRNTILGRDTQLGQWNATVDLAFRKHYGISTAELSARTLGVAASARREAILELLDRDLRIVIEIRNKLAHGQWIYPFNNSGTEVESEKYKLINTENLLSLQFKRTMIGHLANAVHDLVVSLRTHERDFDVHFKKLFQVQTNLRRRSYNAYAQSLLQSKRRARLAMVHGSTPSACEVDPRSELDATNTSSGDRPFAPSISATSGKEE